MTVEETRLPGVLLLKPVVHGDQRGWFTETYTRRRHQDAGIDRDYVQDNHSMSAACGTLRGLHFQNHPHAQTKLVRCTRGRILDVAVDLRRGSPTYRQWVAVELSAAGQEQLLIPKGFGHAFLTLEENAEVQYKVDDYYVADCDRSIRFDDPEIGIDWGGVAPLLSKKDQNAPLLRDSDCNYAYEAGRDDT